MSRPLKEGLDYFPFDVDFFDDPKILYIENHFGEKGELIVVKLLTWIYKNGYYIEWNDEISLLFAKRNFTNIKSALVNEVVKELLKRGFFDEAVFKSFGILTGRGIQKRWKFIIDRSKRKAPIIPEYNLLNSESTCVNSEETHINSEETSVYSELMTQRKGKKIKEKNHHHPDNPELIGINTDETLVNSEETHISSEEIHFPKDSAKNSEVTPQRKGNNNHQQISKNIPITDSFSKNGNSKNLTNRPKICSVPESLFNIIRDYYNRSPTITEAEKLNEFVSIYGLDHVNNALKLATLRHPDALIPYTEKVCNTIRNSHSKNPSEKSQNPQLFDPNVDYSKEKEKLKIIASELLEKNRSVLNDTDISKIESFISEEKYLSALQTFTDLRIPYEEIPP